MSDITSRAWLRLVNSLTLALRRADRMSRPAAFGRETGLNGGARRDRTDDLMLAKHALSQLSYGPAMENEGRPGRNAFGPTKWWAWEDLNFRPHAYQARALTN